jgi:hypothetical protein
MINIQNIKAKSKDINNYINFEMNLYNVGPDKFHYYMCSAYKYDLGIRYVRYECFYLKDKRYNSRYSYLKNIKNA